MNNKFHNQIIWQQYVTVIWRDGWRIATFTILIIFIQMSAVGLILLETPTKSSHTEFAW